MCFAECLGHTNDGRVHVCLTMPIHSQVGLRCFALWGCAWKTVHGVVMLAGCCLFMTEGFIAHSSAAKQPQQSHPAAGTTSAPYVVNMPLL